MIKWNEVTWYSKLLAIIFFIGVLPTLSFYIGGQYQNIKSVENKEYDVSNWKTYQNNEYGFELKYPRTFVEGESISSGIKPIIYLSNNSEEDLAYIDVSGPHSFPVDSYEGVGENTPLSKKLNTFNEFVKYDKSGGEREIIGGFDTFLQLGHSEFTPTLFVDIGDNKYLYITMYKLKDFGSEKPLYRAIFDTLKKI